MSTPSNPGHTQGVFIGTAGWSVPRACAERFPSQGTHLERYSGVFNAVEINSSFYRPHRRQTYEKWAASTPENFRFRVKVPKDITHRRKLVECEDEVANFLEGVSGLGFRLGPLLVQLPPKLTFDQAMVSAFFGMLRSVHPGLIVCEPRHASWFEEDADALLAKFQVARVAADPALSEAAARPGGWTGAAYYRLHGSPRMYYSAYGPEYVARLAADVAGLAAGEAWCIFDNTAAGAATDDALMLASRFHQSGTPG